jgi:hypothetical protein
MLLHLCFGMFSHVMYWYLHLMWVADISDSVLIGSCAKVIWHPELLEYSVHVTNMKLHNTSCVCMCVGICGMNVLTFWLKCLTVYFVDPDPNWSELYDMWEDRMHKEWYMF